LLTSALAPLIRLSYGRMVWLALPYTIGLVQNGPNSENGKKLINFLLDKPAQSSVSARSWGLPVRNDVA
ncbi:hypothetical protein, partial [Pseudomonas aeruginosa]|uniref:hypothetical protein n=1 Tax=Pseudomonas aeruginosa TaxID=287 RepID=UPI000AE3D29A